MILREVLHAHIPLLTAQSTVRDAVDKMDIYQFPALVVINEDSYPIGVLTEGDVCRAAVGREGLLKIAYEPAVRYATLDPTCISPQVEISDALQLMVSSGITLLPVVEDEKLLGVVLRVDLMQAMLQDW